jgi:alpha-D-ribose 1-methylphosphonate 5-triphosphate diphosphatase
MISAAPARVMGLDDRGTLATGSRADVVVMNPETRVIEATIAGGRLACASREAGARLMRAGLDRALAAE